MSRPIYALVYNHCYPEDPIEEYTYERKDVEAHVDYLKSLAPVEFQIGDIPQAQGCILDQKVAYAIQRAYLDRTEKNKEFNLTNWINGESFDQDDDGDDTVILSLISMDRAGYLCLKQMNN